MSRMSLPENALLLDEHVFPASAELEPDADLNVQVDLCQYRLVVPHAEEDLEPLNAVRMHMCNNAFVQGNCMSACRAMPLPSLNCSAHRPLLLGSRPF